MKKIITSLALLAFAFTGSAQGIEIFEPGEAVDVSGTVIELTSGEASMHQNFDIKNVSGSTQTLRVERLRIVELAGTMDYLCWGSDCYGEELVSASNPFISLDDIDVDDDSLAILFTYHETKGFAGCVQYRYYIVDDSGTRLDSVDVSYCSTVSINENEKIKVSIYPNPASDLLNITMKNTVNNVDFVLYNILGEKVILTNLNAGLNTVNVEKLPNGIYFYSIVKENKILETKKLVIKH